MAATLNAAHELLTQAVEQLATSDDWMTVLRMSKQLPQYSPGNCLLLAVQGAQGRVMGYQAWRKIPAQGGGYCQVARGAKSLKVLAPLTRTRVESGAEAGAEGRSPGESGELPGGETRVTRVVGFRLVSVFDEAALVSPPDLSAAESLRPQILDGDAPHLLWDALAAQIGAAGYHLDTTSSRTAGTSNGITDFDARMVWIRPELPPAQRVKTLAHELAHVRLHAPDVRPADLTRELGEVEAESVAFLVTHELGVDSSAYSIPYVTGWADGDTSLVLATADRAVSAAREITTAVDAFLNGAVAAVPDVTEAAADAPGPAANGPGELSVLHDRPALRPVAWPDSPGSPGHETPGQAAGEVSGELHQGQIRGRVPGLSTTIGTPAGHWRIGWRPERGSFTAEHVATEHVTELGTAGRGRDGVRVTRVIGALPQELASLGALEQRLGFALPHSVREHLTREQLARPAALTGGRNFTGLYPGDRSPLAAPDPSERPTPGSQVSIRGDGPGTPVSYAAAMTADPPVRAWSQAGFTVEILSADRQLEAEFSDRQALAYRLSHDSTVIFSGDDILAPLDTDPASDTAIRQVVVLLCEPDDVPLSPDQVAFLKAHAATLNDLTTLPPPPYPPGTRIAVTPPGEARPPGLGTVVSATLDRGGTVTSYSWRPDTTALPGHPWRDNLGHTLVSPADHVTATLAAVDVGLTGWTPSTPLAFGARTSFLSDEGEPVSATVVRCYPGAGGWEYELRPDLPNAAGVRVAAEELIPASGTAWPHIRAIVDARDAAGLKLHDGEVLAAAGRFAQATDGPNGITLINREAADLIKPVPLVGSVQSGVLAFDPGRPPVGAGPDAVAGCATPDCAGPASARVTIGWPSGPAEISQRCQPCAARVAVAGLARGCGVDIRPLDALDLRLRDVATAGPEPVRLAAGPLELVGPAPITPPGAAL